MAETCLPAENLNPPRPRQERAEGTAAVHLIELRASADNLVRAHDEIRALDASKAASSGGAEARAVNGHRGAAVERAAARCDPRDVLGGVAARVGGSRSLLRSLGKLGAAPCHVEWCCALEFVRLPRGGREQRVASTARRVRGVARVERARRGTRARVGTTRRRRSARQRPTAAKTVAPKIFARQRGGDADGIDAAAVAAATIAAAAVATAAVAAAVVATVAAAAER